MQFSWTLLKFLNTFFLFINNWKNNYFSRTLSVVCFEYFQAKLLPNLIKYLVKELISRVLCTNLTENELLLRAVTSLAQDIRNLFKSTSQIMLSLLIILVSTITCTILELLHQAHNRKYWMNLIQGVTAYLISFCYTFLSISNASYRHSERLLIQINLIF